MSSQTKKQTKSDRTRAAILAAAQEQFAGQGYERTTIRDIAALASIDPAMVMRYFGSKDELFARVAVFDLNLPDVRKADRANIGETLVRHFLDLWEGEFANKGLSILLRSAASNKWAGDKLRDLFATQVVPAIAKAGGKPGADQRAGLVATQLLGLALCRYVLKLPPVVETSRETIIYEVGLTIQRYASGKD